MIPKVLPEKMALYHFEACPFCQRVRVTLQNLGLNIELRDIRENTQHLNDLMAGGGSRTVPCLRIEKEDGKFFWMYESSDIIQYLEENYR